MNSTNKYNKYNGTYYIIFPGESIESDSLYDVNHLGNGTIGSTFYFEKGFDRLKSVIDNNDKELLDAIRIYNPNGKQITVEKFINIVTKHYSNRVM